MSGRTDSDAEPAIAEADGPDGHDDVHGADDMDHADDIDDVEDAGEARRARWTAAGTGGLLFLAGCAAALLRLTGASPALVPAAYALGAALCALAAVLGVRGRTRRALWLLVAGTAVMALGDQFD
ncbi:MULTISPECIES: hypothetical protein [unclassified Streptomyces]|uniref:hypothetical protein n=1 Tax=unclassified Streptomyces TaxID=2593676 RepID=UPI00331A016B